MIFFLKEEILYQHFDKVHTQKCDLRYAFTIYFQVCAANFGEVSAVVGCDNTEEHLVS